MTIIQPLNVPESQAADLVETQLENRRGGTATVVVLAMGTSAYGAMETMIVPIIPIAQHKLGGTGPEITWMLSGMFLVAAVTLPLMSRLAEIFDKRNVLAAALTLACLGAVTSALAPNMTFLIIGQMLQGFGMSSAAVGVGVLRDTLPPRRLHLGNGLMLASAAVSAAAGLLLVGPIIQYLDYSFVYWLPVAIIVVTIMMIFVVIPPLAPQARGRADWLGALILGGGLALILIGVTQSSERAWLSWQVLGLIVAGTIAIAAFVAWERRATSPLVDLQAMRHPDVLLILGTVVSGGFSQFVMFVILPGLATMSLATGYGMGGNAYTASFLILTFVCAGALGGATAPILARHFGSYAVMLLVGALFVIAAVLLLLIGAVTWFPFVAAALGGLAAAGGQIQQLNMLVDRFPPDRASSTAGSMWVVRAVSQTFGSQVTAAILAAHLIAATNVSSWTGYAISIGLIAASGAVIIVLTSLIRMRRGL